MKLQHILYLMCGCSLLSWIALFVVVFMLDPVEYGLLGVLVVYAIVFVAVFTLAASLGTLARVIVKKDELPVRHVKKSMRQGFLLGLLVVVSLWLSHMEMLRSWVILLLVLALSFVELYFIARRPRS